MDTASAALLKEMADEMSHEIYLAGNHPMLGVDRVMVRRWRDRILDLLASLPAPAPLTAECEWCGRPMQSEGCFTHYLHKAPTPAAPEEHEPKCDCCGERMDQPPTTCVACKWVQASSPQEPR